MRSSIPRQWLAGQRDLPGGPPGPDAVLSTRLWLRLLPPPGMCSCANVWVRESNFARRTSHATAWRPGADGRTWFI